MMRKFTAMLAAFAFAATAFAPAADARDHRRDGYYDGGRHYRDHDRRRHYRDHDDDGDEIAAGVVGLVLGLAIGSLATQSSQQPQRARCYDNYRRCAPPPRSDDYYYDQSRDDRRYDDRGSAYERDYGLEGGYSEREQCMRRERQWDRYANRYVTVDVPC